MSFLDNFRAYTAGSAIEGPSFSFNDDNRTDGLDKLSRDDVKTRLIQEVKTWRDQHPDNVKDTIFEKASDEDMANYFDRWAAGRTKDYFGNDYSAMSADKIADEELSTLNYLLYSIKSDDFFKEGKDFKEEVNKYRDAHYPNSRFNIPANNLSRDAIRNGIERGQYRTRQSAFQGINDYLGGVAQSKSQPTPAEEQQEYVTISFVPGDSLGQKIIDAGLATDNGLWGDNGDVAFYANQMGLNNPNMVNAGSTFRVAKRK